MIIPMLFQQNDMTVLDVMGMLKVTHSAVRLQDITCAWVPAPKEKSDRAVAEATLLPRGGQAEQPSRPAPHRAKDRAARLGPPPGLAFSARPI